MIEENNSDSDGEQGMEEDPPQGDPHSGCFNSLAPGRCGCNLKLVIFKLTSRVDILSISCEIALRWMTQDFIDDKSTLVQVMAWCRQATSHYLGQCRPRSISPYGIARPLSVACMWKYRSGSTLALVILCCLMAPSHYLNQCWIMRKVPWHSSEVLS